MNKMNKKNMNMPNAHLHDLFVDGLKDVFNAEGQLVKALKTLSAASQNEVLKGTFDNHLKETDGHIEKLKTVFQKLELPARGKECKAMKGLIEEANEILNDFKESEAIDSALIAAAQKIEHYEIATYGSLATFAKNMKHDDVAAILAEILEDEKIVDEKLTQIAMEDTNLM